MSFNNLFYAWIILHGAFCLTSVAETIIWRNPKDDFEIPQEKCWNDTERQCNSMGGTQRKNGTRKVPCACQCNVKDMNVFGWFDNQWKCGRNSAVRTLADHDHQECPFKLFYGETSNSPLATVVPYEYRENEISTLYTGVYSCQLQWSFSYLDCKNSWNIKEPNKGLFYLKRKGINHYVYIYSKSYIGSYGPSVYGHIIKLKIHCFYFSTYCVHVVFKVTGMQKCPVVYLTIPTAPTTKKPSTTTTTTTTAATSAATTLTTTTETTTTTTKPTTEAAKTTSSPQTTTNSPFSMTQSTSHSFSTHPHSTYIPAIPKTKESTSDSTTRNPNPTYGADTPIRHNRDASTDDKGGISGIIAGVVGGLVGLIIILVILAFVWFKRKRNAHSERATVQEEANDNVYDEIVEENHSLQPLPSGNDDYSYTYMDAHPIVIEVQSGTALQAQENSPVFTELEKPDSEENHVYGALQNYDPHIYSALNSPTKKTMHFDSNDGDVKYHNDTEVVDSTVYQELNSNRQSSIEEQYEPLRHSRIKPVDDRIASAAI